MCLDGDIPGWRESPSLGSPGDQRSLRLSPFPGYLLRLGLGEKYIFVVLGH